MLYYIFADFKRIFVRVSRIVATVLIFALSILIAYATREGGSLGFLQVYKQMLNYIPVAFGVIELLAIFSDDFKAKSMQIAIGCGIGRNRVIVSKWLEFVIFSVMDWASMLILTLIASAIFGNGIQGVVVGEIIIIMFHIILKNITIAAYVGILAFVLQSITTPMIIYILLSTGIVETIVNVATINPTVAMLHLDSRTPLGMVNYAQARMAMGTFPFLTYLGIAAYIALGLIITMLVFKKKELEF